jgi:aromatic-L-amino-acid/L-tryptophan decarboxylase
VSDGGRPRDVASRGARELELSASEMRRLVALTLERLIAHVESLPDQPSADVEGAALLARSLREGLPEEGAPYERLLEVLFDRAVPKSFNTAGPGYLAYIPGGGLVHAGIADLIADVTNRFVGIWTAAPGLVQIEANVGRWFCDMVGYPPSALGLLTTGGSMANLIALVTARRERLPGNFLSGVLYASDQAHHSVQKAALLAGFPPANVRSVPTDERFRIRPEGLASAVAADRAAGLTPFLLVANGGTTNTGAVDDLEACAEIARAEGLWLHVDAAYGGFFILTERGRRALRGLDRADSITLDPHKGLFLPYGTGSVLVRDGQALRRAHSVHAEYLPPVPEDPDFVDFSTVSPELSRDFRGLRAWLPIKMHGIGAFRRTLDEKLDLAEWAAKELRTIPGVDIVAEPQLSLLAFRIVRPGRDAAALDDLNRRVMEAVNARRRVYITSTMARGRFLIRICVLSFRTHLDRLQMAIEDIRAAIAETR